ncbi:MAG: hypothetical protein OHK0029_06180 [Armatimonadaceae bacterium]
MTTRNALLVLLLLIGACSLYGYWVYPDLPALVPCHWNIRGEVDGWMPKQKAVIFGPGIVAALTMFLAVAPRLSPKPFAVENFRQTFNLVFVLVGGMIAYLHLIMLRAALVPDMDSGRTVVGGIMAFFALIANQLGRVRRNLWVGVRTPWTLASDAVWVATHRFAARLWTISGAICALLTFMGFPLMDVFSIFIACIFVPVAYSYYFYQKYGGNGNGTNSDISDASGSGRNALLFLAAALITAGSAQAQTNREVEFAGSGGLTLKGTLELPKVEEGKKVPAVLLLPGSGNPDRNGNVPPLIQTDLLKQIAERLAKEGIASLRFDKRSVQVYAAKWPRKPEEISDFFRWENFTGDALAAYRFLAQQPQVDSRQVGIAGHSEGGLIALQLAHDLAGKPDQPAAVGLLATAGRNLGVVIREQLAFQLPRQLPDEKQAKEYLDYSDRALTAAEKGEPFPKGMPPGLQGLFNPSVAKLLTAYTTIDPLKLAAAYPGPVLIAQGEDDVQVSSERDAPRLQEALKKRKTGSVELLLLPKTGHMMQNPAQPPAKPGAPAPAPQVSPQLLDTVAAWFQKNLRP